MLENIQNFSIYDMEDCNKELTQAIENYYDIGKVVELKKTTAGETNRNFIVTTEKDGTTTKYFAKLYNAAKSISALEYEYEFGQYFNSNSKGVMDCAEFIKTKDGDYRLLANVEKIGKDALFAVSTLLPGETRDEASWRGDKMDDEGRKSVATGLARFHVFSDGFKTKNKEEEPEPGIMYDMEQWEYYYTEVLETMNGNPELQPYYDYFITIRDDLMKYFMEWKEAYLVVKEDIPECVTHGDTGPNNYRYDGNTPVGTCDLDWVKVRPRIFDLAFSMVEILANFDLETGITTFDPAHLRNYADDYDAEIEKHPEHSLGKLSETERRLLPCMMGLTSVQMFNYDRFGYMLSGNSCCSVEDHIGVSYYGFSIINCLHENEEEYVKALV